MLMPSPTGPGLNSAFSPYTDSPSSPANFNQVFSNRCVLSASSLSTAHVLMDSPRSSGAHSDHLVPPPSPYPATVDPSPVDSNGTSATDHTEVDNAVIYCREHAVLTSTQIEDDAQDDMNDIRSPATEDIISPASQTSQSKVP